MANKEFLPEELNEVERALASLQPKQSGVDRDRLLYLAGQASVERIVPRRFGIWQATTLVSTSAAVVLAVILVVRGESQVVSDTRYVERKSETSESPVQPQQHNIPRNWNLTEYSASIPDVSSTKSHYLTMRRNALKHGFKGIGSIQISEVKTVSTDIEPAAPVTYWSERQRLLENDRIDSSGTNNSL